MTRPRRLSADAERLVDRALTAAASGEDEETIRNDVLAFALRDPKSFKQAKRHADDCAKSLPGYWSDRLKRIMDAVASDRPVQSPAPDMAETYKREERLASLEPDEAFAWLCEESSELRDLEARVATTSPFPPEATHRETFKPFLRWRREISRVVGPRSTAADPLLRTMTAEHAVSTELLPRLGL